MAVQGDKVLQVHITWAKRQIREARVHMCIFSCGSCPSGHVGTVGSPLPRAQQNLSFRERMFVQRLLEVVEMHSAVAYMHACVSPYSISSGNGSQLESSRHRPQVKTFAQG